MKTIIFCILGFAVACQQVVDSEKEEKFYYEDVDAKNESGPNLSAEEIQLQLQRKKRISAEKRVPHPAWRQKGRVHHIQHMPDFRQSRYSNFVSRPLFMRYARRNGPFFLPQFNDFIGKDLS